MITKYKNISISKIKDSNDNPKAPTHSIVVSDKDYQNKQTVGKLWTKEGNYGKFLAGVMSDTRTFNEKPYEGYCIVNERELDALIKKASELTEEEMKENSPLGKDYPTKYEEPLF